MERHEIIEQLKKIEFVQCLETDQLEKLADKLIRVSYDKDDHIVQEGRPGETFFFILEGSVSVLQEKPNREKFEIAVIGAPSYFGEVALMQTSGNRRTATVKAREKMNAYMLCYDSFESIVLANEKSKACLQKSIERKLKHNGDNIFQNIPHTHTQGA